MACGRAEFNDEVKLIDDANGAADSNELDDKESD
jgi:hypothetical protein